MAQNDKLSKESQFIYQIFQTAIKATQVSYRVSKMTDSDIPPKAGDPELIIAGGAIRDLYFSRQTRDIDLYYNASVVNPQAFAQALARLDINGLARKAGFESVSVRRNSDGSYLGKQKVDDDGEDWGDVSEDARTVLRLWATYYHRAVHSGKSASQAVVYAHTCIPTANVHLLNTSTHKYVTHLVASTSNSSSASSGTGDQSHPLKSVEEFRVVFNDRYAVDVELMGVEASPVKYMMTHFAVKLSRAYYDGTAVHFTSDFMQDARNKTITVACPVEHARFERLFSYYLPKMKSYFPDFEVRVDLDAMNPRSW